VGRAQYRLTRAIARETRSLQPDVRYLQDNGYERGPGNLDVALQFFLSTYDRFPSRPDSQLVDTITATEAVLGSGVANTFKLVFRVAGILGRTDAERVQVFDDIRRFYAIRNSVVHGDRLNETQWQLLGRVDDAREYIRRLLVAFVRLAASSSSTRYTKQFFKENLDRSFRTSKQDAECFGSWELSPSEWCVIKVRSVEAIG
jgi:hypothetical protein